MFDALQELEGEREGGRLKRCLNAVDLTSFGVASMIGAGIFVMTGVAASEKVFHLVKKIVKKIVKKKM